MIIGIGTDIVEINRIKNAIQTRPKFGERVFTKGELAYCQRKGNSFASLAARFAAKEAVSKALGTGIRNFGWQDIEVINDDWDKPSVKMYGKALLRAQELGVIKSSISLSHSHDYAVAMVVLEGE